jgi:hypothetical protein
MKQIMGEKHLCTFNVKILSLCMNTREHVVTLKPARIIVLDILIK